MKTDSSPDPSPPPDPPPGKRVTIGNLVKESTIYGLVKIVDPAIGFLLLPIMSVLLTPEEYGFIGFFTATSTVVFTLVSLGIHQAFLRFFTEAQTPQQGSRVAGTAVLLAIGYWATILPFGWLLARPLAGTLFNQTSPALIYTLLVLALVETLDALGCNLLQASGRAWAFLVATLVNVLAVRLIALALVVAGCGAIGWIVGESLGRMVAMAVILAIAMRGVRFRVDVTEAKQMSWYGMMLVPAMLSFYVMAISDKYLLRFLADDSFAAIGFYGIGERIAAIMHLTNMAIILAWQRFAFRNMHERGGGKQIADGMQLYAAFAGFVALGLMTLGDDLLRWVIDPSYAPGFPVIVPLTLAAWVGGLANVCDIGLHKQRRPQWISVIVTLSAILNIAANACAIPLYGFLGAAWATLASQCVRLVAMFVASQAAFRIPLPIGRVFWLGVVFGCVFLTGQIITRVMGDNLVSVGLQVIVIVALPLALWAVPIWDTDHRQWVRGRVGKLLGRAA
ncbi:MAG: oligosaccharide flippase family protein [Planctomycetota bacterium]